MRAIEQEFGSLFDKEPDYKQEKEPSQWSFIYSHMVNGPVPYNHFLNAIRLSIQRKVDNKAKTVILEEMVKAQGQKGVKTKEDMNKLMGKLGGEYDAAEIQKILSDQQRKQKGMRFALIKDEIAKIEQMFQEDVEKLQ